MSECLRMDMAFAHGYLEGFEYGLQLLKASRGECDYPPIKSMRSPWRRLSKHYERQFRRLK